MLTRYAAMTFATKEVALMTDVPDEEEIGADAYGANAVMAVDIGKSLRAPTTEVLS